MSDQQGAETPAARTRSSGATRTVYFLDDRDTTPKPIEVTEPLALAVARAALVNEGKDRFLVSFSSLFIGLVAGADPVGEWLRGHFESSGASLDELLSRRGLRVTDLRELRDPPSTDFERPWLRSASALSAITEAQRLANDMHVLVDTRHVMAAYITLPAYHDDDFRAFKINRLEWAEAFSKAMAERYPQEERFWRGFRGRVFPPPTPPGPALDLRDENLEPHVGRALRLAAGLAGDGLIEPLHVAIAVISLAGQTESAAFRRFTEIALLSPPPRPTTNEAAMPEGSRLAEDLRRQLAYAQRPETGGTGTRRLWGRDLVTAALLCPDQQLAASMERAQRPIEVVRDRWYAYVVSDAQGRARDEWDAWWLAAGVSRPGAQRAGYATETDQGTDRLGIKHEAEALARLILDKDVEPPLSIGLLGDWGSGKSFFIEQIQKAVSGLSSSSSPHLVSNVVEIEFNAWHASDANLWASLVTHIFDTIWDKVSPSASDTPDAARKRLVEEINRAKGAVHEAEAQVAVAREALAIAEKDLEQRKQTLAWNDYAKTVTTKKLKSLAKNAGWYGALETINDVEDAAKTLAVSGQRLRLAVAALMERPFLHIAAPTALLAGVTGAIWFGLAKYGSTEWWGELTRWITTIAGGIAAIVAPLRTASGKVGGLANTLEQIRRDYDQQVAKTATPKQAAALADARRELASAQASVDAAKSRLAELLNQQATLDPRRRLGAFLQERVQSTLYRSQQGIISLVHKDFRQLSKYMKDLRSHPDDASASLGLKRLDRIVIYVDDLDRCRPDQVVHMLEAVHLLLALDLFVVVVAVDSRWLTRALEVHYKELLNTGNGGHETDGLRASTPQSYLEKIFQITYALGPMDATQFEGYVAFLAGERDVEAPVSTAPAVRADDPAAKDPASPGIHQAAAHAGAGSVPDRGRPDSAGDGQSNGKSATAPPPAPRLPPPHAVRIDKQEQALIVRLVPLLPTPRIAKRLVNVYRLIKAGKDVAALEQFQTDKRWQSCLLMLAILFGRPAIAAQLCRALHERQAPFDKGTESLRDAIRRRSKAPDEPAHLQDDWRSLLATLDQLDITTSVGECAREPIEVARYSLVSGHDWHTWTRAMAANASSTRSPPAPRRSPRAGAPESARPPAQPGEPGSTA